jgi:hypothetical protein
MKMNEIDWLREFRGAVTICDLNGVVLEMNDTSAEAFQKYGGKDLIGKNLLDCHPEPARSKLALLLETGGSNVYTTEKNGIKKLIYQAPWYMEGQRRGMVELSLEIPAYLPHFIR